MNCKIREWKITDKESLALLLNNKKILDNLRDGIPWPYTQKDAEDFIAAMLAADKTKTFAFAITADEEVIGSIGVFRGENIHCRTAEMGYYLGEAYWGKGFGTSAVRQICAYVLRIRILSGFLRNRSPSIRPPAGFWKRPVFRWRGFCAAML